MQRKLSPTQNLAVSPRLMDAVGGTNFSFTKRALKVSSNTWYNSIISAKKKAIEKGKLFFLFRIKSSFHFEDIFLVIFTGFPLSFIAEEQARKTSCNLVMS